MFTGIIQSIGRLASSELRGGDRRMVFAVGSLGLDDVQTGDSIAVAGVCLTALDISGGTFAADVYGLRFGVNLIPHTQEVTTFAERRIGDAVNIEVDRMARYAERLAEFREKEPD